MAKTTVTVSLDKALAERAATQPGGLSQTIETALARLFDRRSETDAADLRWAEENALAVEALAGGAQEVADR